MHTRLSLQHIHSYTNCEYTENLQPYWFYIAFPFLELSSRSAISMKIFHICVISQESPLNPHAILTRNIPVQHIHSYSNCEYTENLQPYLFYIALPFL